jgi:hypothetical protein
MLAFMALLLELPAACSVTRTAADRPPQAALVALSPSVWFKSGDIVDRSVIPSRLGGPDMKLTMVAGFSVGEYSPEDLEHSWTG